MNSEWQSLQPQTQQELKNTMNAMQPPQSVEEVKATLETTEKGGVRQSIRNCLTVFQRDPVLAGAIAYNILTDRKDIMHLETILTNFINVRFKHPAVRRYEIENLYEYEPEKPVTPKVKKGGIIGKRKG